MYESYIVDNPSTWYVSAIDRVPNKILGFNKTKLIKPYAMSVDYVVKVNSLKYNITLLFELKL